jgi:hypothetical protein
MIRRVWVRRVAVVGCLLLVAGWLVYDRSWAGSARIKPVAVQVPPAATTAAGPKPAPRPIQPRRTATPTHRAAPAPAAPARTLVPTPPAKSRTAGGAPTGDCPLFPADNIWHARVDGLPVLPASATYVASIGSTSHVHPDFGSGLIDGKPFGIPVTEVPAAQPAVRVGFDYDDESDAGPYPLPADARIEGGPAGDGDRHVILHDAANCTLYELFGAQRGASGAWSAQSGAIWNLRSDALRPAGWTSADAAGLPIMAGLVRYEEVAAGRIDHAIRITVPRSQDKYLWPARHAAGSTGSGLPPMGLRLRLKANVDIAGMPAQARVIATAMKTYGVIVADNGSAWYVTGTEDSRWQNDALDALKSLTGSQFEAVDTSGLMVNPNSGATG